jgi:hypothetical protein
LPIQIQLLAFKNKKSKNRHPLPWMTNTRCPTWLISAAGLAASAFSLNFKKAGWPTVPAGTGEQASSYPLASLNAFGLNP